MIWLAEVESALGTKFESAFTLPKTICLSVGEKAVMSASQIVYCERHRKAKSLQIPYLFGKQYRYTSIAVRRSVAMLRAFWLFIKTGFIKNVIFLHLDTWTRTSDENKWHQGNNRANDLMKQAF